MLKVGLWEHEREAGGLCLGAHVSRPHAWRASICSWWAPPHQTAWCAKLGDPDSVKAVPVCRWPWTWGKSLVKSRIKLIICVMDELVREAQSERTRIVLRTVWYVGDCSPHGRHHSHSLCHNSSWGGPFHSGNQRPRELNAYGARIQYQISIDSLGVKSLGPIVTKSGIPP